MKIRPVGAELLHAEGRTDGRMTDRHDEDKSHFPQFCNVPNKPRPEEHDRTVSNNAGPHSHNT
jgi:hypothetical protein